MARVIVVGGGASGMMAAIFAADAGASVTLLEHNEKLGKKVYITGKGRCNFTNDCDRDTFLTQVARNPRFLYSALDFFSPQDMMRLLENAGCPVTVQRGRRAFPASEKASDVTRALTALLRQRGVEVRLNTEVTDLVQRDGRVAGVRLAGGAELPAGAVVLATGGLSYPSTGSTGDGWRLAASAGHTLADPEPVLVGLAAKETWPAKLQGISLKNVSLSLFVSGKIRWQELGEMLFTHFGVSGPLVLEVSCHLPADLSTAELLIDLKPGLTPEQLDARLRRDFLAAGRRQLAHVLPGLLPARMAELFPSLCGVPADLPCSQVTGPQREALVHTLKALPLHIAAPRPLEEAVVTRGGVSVRELQPGTMASRLCSGLFFAGELIDVDAHTGGYNLQIAWSTGALAGAHAAAHALKIHPD